MGCKNQKRSILVLKSTYHIRIPNRDHKFVTFTPSIVKCHAKAAGAYSDIVYAYNNMQEAVDNLNYIRENVDKEADVIYQQALGMADKLCIEPVIPRTVMRQAYRNNVPAETPLMYYKWALIIPLLDTIISEITVRFKKTHCIAGKVLCLVPSIICDEDSIKFQELVKMYESDLPNPNPVDQELMLWKKKWSTVD